LPLKKPKDVPKIPKTRKKKADSVFSAIPEKKPDKLEYICKTLFRYNELNKKQFTVIVIETIIEFTNFIYEVSLKVQKDRNEINVIIMGLTAKTDIVPQVLPAKGEYLLEDLVGEFTVNVYKQDGSVNTGIYNLNFYNKSINLIKEFKPAKKNNRLFCKFEVAEDEFTFGNE